MSADPGREPEIALVLSPDGWVDELHRHCADHGGARVRCIVVEPSVALEEDYGVLVATDRWSALTRPFVDALHARGRGVLVVVDEDGAGAREFADRLQVDGMVSSSASPAAIVETVVAMAPSRTTARATSMPILDADAPEPPCPTLVVVGGPTGSGATEIAIGLGAAGIRRRVRGVVVDADGVSPSMAPRLGLPVEPNLCTAVDAVAYGLGAVPGALFDLGDEWPAVLVGVPGPEAGRGLRAADVAAVVDVLAERYAPVVVDVGEGGLRDGRQRDLAASLAARASAVVAVGLGSPVGVLRLFEWLTAVGACPGDIPVHAVLNRAPTARARRAELSAELVREGAVTTLTFAPSDPRVEDAAWDAAMAERCPFARALDELAHALGDDVFTLSRPGARR